MATVKEEDSSKMTYIFHCPVWISKL